MKWDWIPNPIDKKNFRSRSRALVKDFGSFDSRNRSLSHRAFFTLAFVVLLMAFWPHNVSAESLGDDKIVFGGVFTLASGQTIQGDLVILGGSVTLESGSQVTGDVILLGGTVTIEGRVDGDVAGLGGSITLQEGAVIYGNVNLIGAVLDQEAGADVLGDIQRDQTGLEGDGNFYRRLHRNFALKAIAFIWQLFLLFSLSGLAVLVVMAAPRRIDNVRMTFVANPFLTVGIGALTVIVSIPVLGVLAFSLVFLPVGILGAGLLLVSVLYGWVSLGLEIGLWLGTRIQQEIPAGVAAGLGTFLLTLAAYGFDGVISRILCLGWLVPLAGVAISLGTVVLSRFGGRVYLTPDLPPENPENGETPDLAG